jgi:hypothetical protein
MKKSINKTAIASKTIIDSKESVNLEENRLTEINLSKFADKLASVDLKQKREKETLYIYPDSFTKDIINGEEGRKYRNRLRSRLKSFSNNIFFYAKGNNIESLKSEITRFDEFYKSNYRINDYSIHSITNSKEKEKDILFMLEIIKEVKGN